jgi:hypothetical protein
VLLGSFLCSRLDLGDMLHASAIFVYGRLAVISPSTTGLFSHARSGGRFSLSASFFAAAGPSFVILL